MNIIKRLPRLSVDDLQELQTAILGEIQRREGARLTPPPLTPILARIQQRRKELSAVAMTLADGSVSGGPSVPVSIPAPAAAHPVSPRRAA